MAAGVADGFEVSRREGLGTASDVPDADWQPYEWAIWGIDGSDYRLRIGVGREGQLTGLIEDVAGEWTSEVSEE